MIQFFLVVVMVVVARLQRLEHLLQMVLMTTMSVMMSLVLMCSVLLVLLRCGIQHCQASRLFGTVVKVDVALRLGTACIAHTSGPGLLQLGSAALDALTQIIRTRLTLAPTAAEALTHATSIYFSETFHKRLRTVLNYILALLVNVVSGSLSRTVERRSL